ncbi:FAD-binding oxidoreductase [Sinorhizobium alkalisoli]|uniref:FAD-linked oxidase n=1 Tax=Sinorhizobium alkalisoli TaxID=1752398 RepID=A0A1E3VEP9_9HYPH|nr:FAD-binding oxidoreductase [Sinorhizobium alkalisoli]ODR91917.1 FAD-linked oxidase [Sinorhizobium alkalisoli]
MSLNGFENWRWPAPESGRVISPDDYEERLGELEPMAYLPVGKALSYGDSSRNSQGTLIDSARHNRILSFDPGTGVIVCEAGVTLNEVLARAIPHRFFLPVTPRTGLATIGGAVANDIHGDNHHARGTFGNHIRRLTLMRSDGERLTCSTVENAEIFAATIGGLGLTGLILEVELRLMKVPSPHVQQHACRFDDLDEGLVLLDRACEEHEYAVAWIDQLSSGRRAGRGVLWAADHADSSCEFPDIPKRLTLSVPYAPPFNILNTAGLRVFNEYHFRRVPPRETVSTEKWTSYFHPLDRYTAWNRLYGPRGPCQHQSVFPVERARETTLRLLETARRAGHASFQTTLHRFGDNAARGLLSFARPGFSLTLDFANQGEATVKLLGGLDRIVVEAGGVVNPGKDFRMEPEIFEASFPAWKKLEALRDPALVSDFWRRTALALRR